MTETKEQFGALSTLTSVSLPAPAEIRQRLDDEVEKYVKQIEDEMAALNADVDTEEGRKAIKSFAYKIARTKTGFDDASKQLTEDYKGVIDAVNESRRGLREKFDALKAKAREPLTIWEEKESARVAYVAQAFTDLNELCDDHNSAEEFEHNIDAVIKLYDTPDPLKFLSRIEDFKALYIKKMAQARILHKAMRDEEIAAVEAAKKAEREERERIEAEEKRRAEEAEARRKAELERVEREKAEAVEAEKERARLAAEKAKADAQKRLDDLAREAEKERAAEAARAKAAEDRAAQAEKDAKLAKDAAEAREREAKAIAEREREAAAAKAEADKIAAVEADRALKRAEDERKAEEAKARAADFENRKKVNSAALADLIAAGVPDIYAKACIQAIAKDSVRSVKISY